MNNLFLNELSKYTVDQKVLEPIKIAFRSYFESITKVNINQVALLVSQLSEDSAAKKRGRNVF